MPAFFRFRDLEGLAAAIADHGLAEDIPLQNDLSPLAQPVEAGSLRLANRLGIHPMEGCDGTPEGQPADLTLRRWVRFGAGGAGLVWGEAMAVAEDGRANPRQLYLCERNAPAIADLVERTRRAHREVMGPNAEVVIGAQLTHSGRYSFRGAKLAQHDRTLDAMTLTGEGPKRPVTAEDPLLSDDELLRIADRFVDAAMLAARLGFDFVDIKQCHRYLLNELLAARTRPGPFGGSFENRTRLAREIFTRVGEALGPDVALATRLNVHDGVPFRTDPATGEGIPAPYQTPYRHGFGCDEADPLRPDLTEPLRWIGELRALGVRMVNVTTGNPYTNPHVGRPFEKPPLDGYGVPEHPLVGVARHFRLAAAIQRAYPDLIVVGTGYSWLRQYLTNAAAANVAQGRVTVAAVGRGALAYPDYARDALGSGALNTKKVCLGVSYCTAFMRTKKHPLGQFPAGCLPRDPVYVPLWREVEASEGRQEHRHT